ncbi:MULTISPECIES: hypothetical protein [unclassified Xanthomonas]|uniref:hypothetical protein n=1 Tax=unclassified Xanthomonas TaxID=2643310 RepID=UPI000CEEA89D|nr:MULTISPECIES: hypothetical protein [unclassified Xanthomonas]PPU36955.1 hypothetical protein XspCFBP7912_03715 [Xanthomonas sp. CFBP 7912]RJS02146.1 hypothetical protein XnspCFBP7698_19370 [Xanthomonas sp. CFBP 7698]
MSGTDRSAFRRAWRESVDRFRAEEPILRSSYAGELNTGQVTIEELLERPTRRFLIDGLLKALGWNPDIPDQIVEEVRSREKDSGQPLFFDYLGRAYDRSPAMLVEAKRFDADLPRRPRGEVPPSHEMGRLICEGLNLLKTGRNELEILSSWKGWLTDMIGYVRSLPESEQKGLARVVITAGQWLIVFKRPYSSFVADAVLDPDDVVCFSSFEEMETRSNEIFDLLNRARLIDTLPLTMDIGEALAVIQPGDIQAMFRGVVVSTQRVGPKRASYPHRTVIPAITFLVGNREFAVTRYGGEPVVEPITINGLGDFLQRLATEGGAFEAAVLRDFGREDLRPSPVTLFPLTARAFVESAHPPLIASTAARAAANQPKRPTLVMEIDESGGAADFLAITGDVWFYKAPAPFTGDCQFHNYPAARKAGFASQTASMGERPDSYTASGDLHHCEHQMLLSQRRQEGRCQLKTLETHLCCRACVFHNVCWKPEELPRLPCE